MHLSLICINIILLLKLKYKMHPSMSINIIMYKTQV